MHVRAEMELRLWLPHQRGDHTRLFPRTTGVFGVQHQYDVQPTNQTGDRQRTDTEYPAVRRDEKRPNERHTPLYATVLVVHEGVPLMIYNFLSNFTFK